MIRPGVKVDDATLLKADIDDLYEAKRLVEAAAFLIARVVQCAPLDHCIEAFKTIGCDTMELSRKISAIGSAYQDKWNYGVPFNKAYNKALSLDDSGKNRFYDEVLPYAKHELIRVSKAIRESESASDAKGDK